MVTDKPDYSPNEIVIITGYGFLANTDYKLYISSDNLNVSYDIKTDENGAFQYSYQLDGIYRPNYLVELKDLDGQLITSATFTDSDWPCSSFHCDANDVTMTSVRLLDANTNLPITSCTTNQSISAKLEGTFYNNANSDRTAVILIGDLYQGNTLIEHLQTNGIQGICAVDSIVKKTTQTNILKTFNWTCGETVTIQNLVISWGNSNSSCSEFFSSPSCGERGTKCYTSSNFIVTGPGKLVVHKIFTDGHTNSGITINLTGTHTLSGVTDINGDAIFMPGDGTYTAHAVEPSGYYESANTCSGVVVLSGQTTNCTITDSKLAYCGDGNIDRTLGEQCDDGNNTNGDGCSSTCQIEKANLTVYKHVDNTDGGNKTASDFTINVSGTNVSNPSFLGNESGTSITLDAGSYSVTENSITGYTLNTTGNCSGTIAAGETKTCTLNNVGLPAYISVVKNVVGGTAQSSDFTIGVSGTASANPSSFPGNSSGTSVKLHAHGTYNVTETNGSIDYDVSYSSDCSGSVIGGQATKTCTITNTRKTGTIIIVKDSIPNDSQDFSFTGDLGAFDLYDDSDTTLSNTKTFSNIPTGTYSVSETLMDGWRLNNITCEDPTQNSTGNLPTSPSASINLGVNETVTCTFTNSKASSITITKDSVPNDPQDFQFTGLGSGVFTSVNRDDDSDPTLPNYWTVSGHMTGDYTFSENQVDDWNLVDITCTGTDNSNIKKDVSARNVIISPQPGENINCIFTNLKKTHLIVDKITDPSSDTTTPFSITASGVGTIYGNTTRTIYGGASEDFEVSAGTYSISENVPSGWSLTENTCQLISLTAGQTVRCSITNTQYGKIIIKKDTVPTGLTDSFEFYWSEIGGNINTINISGGSSYTIDNLTPGRYYTNEEPHKTGWNSDRDDTSILCDDGSKRNDIYLSAGETVTCTYTNTKLGTISGYKYEDINGNGTKDDSDLGLENWEIFIDFDNNGIRNGLEKNYDLTDANGYYDLGYIANGSYSICEVLKNGWSPTTQSGNCQTITITNGSSETVNFGNFKLGLIQGRKYNDLNNDGSYDSGEPYLNDWTIRAYKKNGAAWDPIGSFNTGDTGTIGQYRFDNLELGRYKICEVLQTNWTQTSPTGTLNNVLPDEAPRCRVLDITQSNQQLTGKHFGNIQYGSILITKFEDENGNGIKDTNETGGRIDNWTMDLYSGSDCTGNPMTNSINTNSSGEALFDNLIAGLYSVKETLEYGWINTSGLCENVTVTAGNQSPIEIGNQRKSATINIDKSDDVDPITPNNIVTYTLNWSSTNNGGANLKLIEHPDDNIGAPVDYSTILTLNPDWYNCMGNPEFFCKDLGDFTPGTYSGTAIFKVKVLTTALNNDQILNVSWLRETHESWSGELAQNDVADQETTDITVIKPTLTLSKFNNKWPVDQLPGNQVEYTMTIHVLDNNVKDLTVVDLLPYGFKFDSGSAQAFDKNNNPIFISQPTYASPGTWTLGDVNEGEIITLKYTATIGSNTYPGLYKDLAFAYGCSESIDCTIDSQDNVLASAVDSGQTDPGNLTNEFVGTKVNINKETQTTTSLNVKKEETKEGEVLGAFTGLPSTGGKTIWIYISTIAILLGALSIFIGLNLKKNRTLSKIFRLFLILLTFCLITKNSYANSIESLTIRLEQPKTPININKFDLDFVTLDIYGNSITVQCYKKGPSDAGFVQFGSDIAITYGGNSGVCSVDSGIVSEKGTYQFYAKAITGSSSANSETVTIDYNTE